MNVTLNESFEFSADEQGVPTAHCNTLQQLLMCLSFATDVWVDNKSGTSNWVFRGQIDAAWSLVPSAFRDETKWFSSVESAISDDSIRDTFTNVRDLLSHEFYGSSEAQSILNTLDLSANLFTCIRRNELERLSLRKFAEQLDEVSYSVPVDYEFSSQIEASLHSHLHSSLRRLLRASIAKRVDYPVTFPKSQVAALAQHHGVPTRLLDWTDNPLIAIYFAAADAKKKKRESDRIAVWAMNRRTRRLPIGIEFLTPPRSGNGFLAVQAGLFSIDTDANQFFLDTGRWKPLQEQIVESVKEADIPKVLRKVTFPVDSVTQLLKRLEAQRIAKRFLMPTVDNVVDDLR
jgi:hypothetical protein